MTESLPAWLEAPESAGEHQGLQPLGLETVGFWMVDQLLPSLTGTTVHVRYYSFLSWAFWTLTEKAKKENTKIDVDRQQRWRNRMENAMRAATLYENPDLNGLVGVSKTPRLEENDLFPIDREISTTAFDAAFYKPSWRDLRCGELVRERGGTLVELTSTGKKLAELFDQGVRQHDQGDAYRRLLGEEARLPASVIEILAPGLRLDRVPDETDEDEALIELLVRRDTSSTRPNWREIENARARTTGLLLQMVNQSPGKLEGEEDVLIAFAGGRLPDGSEFSPSDAFRTSVTKWKRYYERQQEKAALYSLWVALNEVLHGRELAANEIIGEMLVAFEESDVVIDLLGQEALDLTVDEVQKKLAASQISDDVRQTNRSSLFRQIRDGSGMGNWVGRGLLLLLWITDRWEKTKEKIDPDARRFHSYKGRERLSLEQVTRDTKTRSSWTLARYLIYVVERFVLGQATRVALRKLERGDMRFFIARGDEGYYRVKEEPRIPTGLLSPDEPRIGNLLKMLETLEVIRAEEEGLRLTPRGEDLLARLEVDL